MSDNITLIGKLYQAFGKGDMATLRGGMDASIDWLTHGDPNQIPIVGHFKGPDEVMNKFFRNVADTLDFQQFEPYELHDAGDVVTVLVRVRALVKPSKRTVALELAHIFTIKNGKVTRFREFYDTAALRDALKPAA
jgi:ketosteroid isomerase-like protein